MRTIIDLTDEQIKRLAEYTACHGVSRAEAVRRAVDALTKETEAERRRRVLAETFGAWKHLGIDGLEYQRQIRAEWDREWDPD